ncbi:importin-alpha export receptor [Saccharomycopsis crataegensis]|uniref:Importin-alpha export receptor n=1 Tax=Saccharomycopsis crataegensis TaxID=43959 RepID=A0AAV5QUX6_9ASCO|nr:importin-alpha export receptor [Saccharomycopsis crataegensis]
MSDIQSITLLLQESLSATTANQADQQLRSIETNPGFAIALLTIVDSNQIDNSIRLAGVLFFKNFLNRRWIDADGKHKLNPNDVENIKSKIVKLMIGLNNNNLKKQVGECIAIIANSDFPDKWTNLVDELVESLKTNDLNNIHGVLSVAHSIFKRWRPLFSSDELFLEIKFVLNKFCEPFMQLLVETDKSIDANLNNKLILEQLFENLLLLVKLYYDFNCQDIPEFFEDHMNTLMNAIHKYLVFKSDLLTDKDEDEEPDVLSKVKGSICDLIQLYSTRYQDVFDPLIEKFVQSSWNELTSLTLQVKYDILTSKYLTFLTSIIKIPKYFDIFNNAQVLNEIFINIILPNITLRESDEELFEDDPIEYIKRDIENNDSNTRRSSSTEFLRELKDKNESLVTETVLKYINEFLGNFNSDASNWKQKDTAIYLFIAIAAKGNITGAGVTSTNLLVDVVSFFQQNIARDLMNQSIENPILIVDSIRYLYIFRNQLTKQQLVESFPLLLNHLNSDNYIIYTYSSITIEKILSLRDNSSTVYTLLFNKSDIESIFKDLVTTLFKKILVNKDIPEKLSENDYLMKCLMRVLILNNNNLIKPPQSNFEFVGLMINQLIEIVVIISKNPSNPKFTHYCFECIGIIANYNSNNNPEFVGSFMEIIIPKFLAILGEDIIEFVPYIIQMIAFLLELLKHASSSSNNNTLPAFYKSLVKPMLSPTLWEYKGNIPGNTRLIIDMLEFDRSSFNDDLPGLLGVFQKLISSKVNDSFGFDLLEIILIHVDLNLLKPYLSQIATLILTRLQNSKTTKFIKRLILFFSKLALVDSNFTIKNANVNTLGPDFVTNFVDQLQENLFGNIYKTFFITNIQEFHNVNEKKIVVIGLTNLVCHNAKFTINGPYSSYVVESLNQLFKATVHKSEFFANEKAGTAVGVTVSEDLLNDFENQDFTFGSSYSRLVIIGTKKFDPISDFNNKDIEKGFLMVLSDSKNKGFEVNGADQLDSMLQNELSTFKF